MEVDSKDRNLWVAAAALGEIGEGEELIPVELDLERAALARRRGFKSLGQTALSPTARGGVKHENSKFNPIVNCGRACWRAGIDIFKLIHDVKDQAVRPRPRT